MNDRPEPPRRDPGRPGAEKRIEHQIASVGGGEQHALKQRLGLLGRVSLSPVLVLQPLRAGADRQKPIGTDLHVLVAGLQGLVIERIGLGFRSARRPDHRLVGVGEAAAAEVRHRIGFAPDDVVQDPEAEILQDGADAEDVVIGADHHDRGGGLHQPPDGGQPVAREGVVFGEIGELVPGIVDPVDEALVGARQMRLRAAGCRADRRRRDRLRLEEASSSPRRSRRRGSCRAARGFGFAERLKRLRPGVSPRRSQYAKPESGRGGGTLRHARYA